MCEGSMPNMAALMVQSMMLPANASWNLSINAPVEHRARSFCRRSLMALAPPPTGGGSLEHHP